MELYTQYTWWILERCYNFSISNDLTQMISTLLLRSLTVTLTILLFWTYLAISSDASICSTMTFSPLGTSAHFVVQFQLSFNQTQNGMLCFKVYLVYYYSRADWYGLCDHFVPFNVSGLRTLGPDTLQKLRDKAAWVSATLHGWLKVLLA